VHSLTPIRILLIAYVLLQQQNINNTNNNQKYYVVPIQNRSIPFNVDEQKICHDRVSNLRPLARNPTALSTPMRTRMFIVLKVSLMHHCCLCTTFASGALLLVHHFLPSHHFPLGTMFAYVPLLLMHNVYVGSTFA